LLTEAPGTKTRAWWPWALGAVIVGAAAGLYAWLGNPEAASVSPLPPMSTAPMTAGGMLEKPGSGGDLKMMANRLAEKLAKDPRNGEGWALLGQTYIELRQHKEADNAFTKAAALGEVDAKLLADWADAHVVANNRKWDKAARDIVKRALAADPRSLKALALAGSEAFDRADYKQATVFWQQLRDVAPPDSMDAKLADANIEEAAAMMTGKRATAADAAVGGGTIVGTVALDAALKGKVEPTDTVFVIARAADGSPAPLAVKRYSAADLPISFKLTDADAMTPGRSLSRFGEADLIARISRTGNAMRQAGDVDSKIVRAKAGASNVRLELSARP
jgi:cytochrome c-type biogenesis protein CcmH